ncbi:BatD family protein [Marinomonas sp. C2222]|uniref:BatD family protein n=1 Tax=Marinomonas sargassi TaxID=2984494 RepID=A0ABT2YQL2_9GAMM|nr:BatD family protein [Marinomonas sargassi]MCV2402176.1 BatD family protein [Marinomonas sargassi]
MVDKQGFFSFTIKSKIRMILAWLFPLVLLASSQVLAEGVTASLNKSTVTENEIVQLTLRADFSDTGNGPDLTPLERDFEILGKSQNSQFSFNLNSTTALRFWSISLKPKSVGSFEIPSIKIGEHASNPINLVVKNAPQLLDHNGNPPVIVRADVSEVEPYLQQEVILSVKLYTSVDLMNANRSVPSHSDLVIERLIDDQMDFEVINGTQYQVITQEYLMFPQRSGLVTIPPQTIQAMINTSGGRRIIKVQSSPISLQVLPIPATFPNDFWLPSSQVSINTRLEQTSDQPRIGDTLIWTIDISAKGSLPEQIPAIEFNSTRRYKLYPKPAKFNTRKTTAGITGQQTLIVEVVPTEDGTLVLPDIEVSYWDTENRFLKTATAETNSMIIGPLPDTAKEKETEADIATSEPLPAQPSSVAPISLAKTTVKESPEQPSITVDLHEAQNTFSIRDYAILALLSVASALLLIWLLLLFKKKRQNALPSEPEVPTLQDFAPLSSHDEDSAYDALIECCQLDNLQELRLKLLEWARHRWGDEEIRSIEDIKRLTSVQVTQLLMEAELMMYSSNPTTEWQGTPLADALDEFTSGQAKPAQSEQLKTLYPNF